MAPILYFHQRIDKPDKKQQRNNSANLCYRLRGPNNHLQKITFHRNTTHILASRQGILCGKDHATGHKRVSRNEKISIMQYAFSDYNEIKLEIKNAINSQKNADAHRN